jgi:Zn-dependent protease with chaperone function
MVSGGFVMRTRKAIVSILIGIALLGNATLATEKKKEAKQKPIPVSKVDGPKEKDIQLGKQYAAEIEKEMYVVPNEELTAYINRVGKRLVDTGLLDRDFPYTFKVVQEKSINAFALPGGPMFVHTGLIAAADSEAQMAGVLAHELSHVSLRHGVAGSSKQSLISSLGAIGGAIAGGFLGGGLGELAAQGAQVGSQAWATKYSRSAESEADLLGSYVMAKAGYNPLELGTFFGKLEKEMGGDPGKVSQWFSSHPNPGNRNVAIQQQAPYMAQGPYTASEGDLATMRQMVASLPKDRVPGGGLKTVPANSPAPDFQASQTYRQVNAGALAMSVPDNWLAGNDQENAQVIVLPDGGAVEGVGIGAGIMIGKFQPKQAKTLQEAHEELLQTLIQQNQGQLKPETQPQVQKVDGHSGLISVMSSPSPYQKDKEHDYVVSVGVQNQLIYMIFIGPGIALVAAGARLLQGAAIRETQCEVEPYFEPELRIGIICVCFRDSAC